MGCSPVWCGPTDLTQNGTLMADELTQFFTALQDTAARAPDRTALIDEHGAVSYRDLIAQVDARADALVRAGVQPGHRVALIGENSSAFLLSAFAVWTAGAVLVTIYPSSGITDLAYSIDSSDPVLVLVDAHSGAAVAQAITDARPVAAIDAPQFTAPAVRTDTAPNPAGLRAPLRLICYTSGTTSRPKAIMLSAMGLLNGARTYSQVWHLTEADRTVVALPMAWLYGLNSTSMVTLIAGGTVIVLRRARPEIICEAITTHAATFLAGVTTMFAKLVSYLEPLPARPDLGTLRLCISGGEPRNETVFDTWAALTSCAVLDTFCSSECFPLVTYDPTVDAVPVRGSAGKLVPNAEMRVVGPDGTDVAPGEVGEALVRGPGLMLGYWADEEATAAALTPDGYYRQKDLVRVDERGYVYVVGRISDMIIRGGSNVSPAEVERVLREHPSVRDVSVVGLPDDTYGQKVVAAIVTADGAELDPIELKRFADQQLASYKVPSEYIGVGELPQNSTTGKVDRRQVAAALQHQGARP
jgi:long-chain acyl-CoA synthetase